MKPSSDGSSAKKTSLGHAHVQPLQVKLECPSLITKASLEKSRVQSSLRILLTAKRRVSSGVFEPMTYPTLIYWLRFSEYFSHYLLDKQDR